MTKRVLVVEDDPELGGQLVRRLNEAGYTTTWWQQGRALEREDMPDVELVRKQFATAPASWCLSH
jgi:DNA-binding response OmpR family regulator